MNTAHRRRHRLRLLRLTLGLIGGLGLCTGALGAECMHLRGGELVLSASDACRAQIRRDPALRRQVAQAIGGEVAVAPASPVAAGRSAPASRPAHHAQGLSHPLARMSMLNAQSRYLWSLGNPAPSYYGQTSP